MKKIFLLSAGMALLAAGCMSSNTTTNTGYTPTPQPQAATPSPAPSPVANPTPTPAPASVKTFNVTGMNYSFSPSTITVKKGDTVKIVFKNGGGYPHNFVIDALNVTSKTVNSGESDTVQFTASKAGTFEFYCSVPTHKAKGMMGSLIVQ